MHYCYSTAVITATATSTAATACTVPSGSTLLFATGSPATLAAAASGNTTATVTATLTGLAQGTKYYVIAEAWRTSSKRWYVSASQNFTTVTSSVFTTTAATNLGATSATLNANINPLGVSTVYSFNYSTSATVSAGALSVSPTNIAAGTYSNSALTAINTVATGLTAGTTYYFQIKAIPSGGSAVYGSVLSYVTTASGVLLTSSAATSVTGTSAVLNGSVNANSATATAVSFCYSTSNALASCSGATLVPLPTTYNGTTTSNISTTVTGLSAATTYYFQVKGIGVNTAYSPVLSFTTSGGPLISTPTAVQISGSGVTLGATATSNGASSTVAFCYSTSTLTNCASANPVGYAAASQSPLSASASNTAVSSVISAGLSNQTTYYYQAFIISAVGTSYSAVASFKTLGAPFVCNTNFYQVSATAAQLYVYSLSANKFSTLGANTTSGLNGLGYNAQNNYMYVMKGTTLYEIDSTGTFTSIATVTGAQSTGAGFIGSSTKFLATNGSGTFSVTDVSANPIVSVPFTVTTTAGNSSWGSADLAIIQQGDGTYKGYGMNGSTLNILSFASSTSTSGVVTSRTVTSGTSGQSIPSGAYGASYADQAGDVFFFNNGNSQMWEITAAQLALNSTTAVATLVTTASPLLAGPNDGASCPLSVNPFDAPVAVNDTYTLTINGANPLTINTLGAGITSNDQSGAGFAIKTVTYEGGSTSSAGSTLSGTYGTLNVSDFSNGYFTFTPNSLTAHTITFTYSLIQTGVTSPLTSVTTGTVTIYLVTPQTVTWTPTTSLSATASPYSLPIGQTATTTGNGAITYSVLLSATNTAGCIVNPTTGALIYSSTGVCTVSAVAASTSTNAQSAAVNVQFTVNAATPSITWTPVQSLLTTQSPYTPAAGAVSSSGGAISYAVSGSGNTSGCSIDGATGVLTFTGAGACTVVVTSASTATYGALNSNFSFTVSATPQTMTWAPTTNVLTLPSSFSFTAASSSGSTGITYTVLDAGVTGCTIATNTSPTISGITSAGNCQVKATAAATSSYLAVSQVQTFVIGLSAQGVAWTPAVTALSATASPYSLPAGSTPTDLGSVPITFSVTSFTATTCTVNSSTGAITFTGAGNCVITASAAQTAIYAAASTSVTFTSTLATQVIAWAPTTALLMTSSTATPSVLASVTTPASNGGAITYAVTNAGTTGCTVNSSTGVISYTAVGSCVVTATAAATSTYAAVSIAVTFTISLASQTITWSPTTTFTVTPASPTFTASSVATTSGNGAITYAVSPTSNTAVCSIANSSTPVIAYTSAGACTIIASAAASSSYSAASTKSVTFTLQAAAQLITWSPTNLNPLTSTANFTPSSVATTSGAGAITYTTTAQSGICSISSSSSDVLTTGATAGSCPVTVTAAATALWAQATYIVTFTTTAAALTAQTLTWTPSNASSSVGTGSPLTLTPASLPSSNAATPTFTFAATAGTANCSVTYTGTPLVLLITYTSAGTCVITATSTKTNYATAVVSVTFTFSKSSQTISWAPTTSLLTTTSGQAFSAATVSSPASGGGAITYAVTTGASNTANCSLPSASSTLLSFTGAGSCTVVATAASNTAYNAQTSSQTFTISLATQTVTWTQTNQALLNSSNTYVVSALATTTGNGAISYVITTSGASNCTFTAATLTLGYSGVGSCSVVATAAATALYSSATATAVVFSISLPTQVVTWSPTNKVQAGPSLVFTPSAVPTSTGDGTFVYSVSGVNNTAGCSWNVAQGTISYTGFGQCTVSASANASATWAASTSPASVTFTLDPAVQNVIWSPSLNLNTRLSPYTVNVLATAQGGATLSYEVTSYSTPNCTLTYGGSPVALVLTYNGVGTCEVTATASAIGIYGTASLTKSFAVAGPPAATTFAASGLSAVGAILNGTVNSDGVDTNVSFCYSTSAMLNNCSASDGATVVTSTASPAVIYGSDTNDGSVSVDLTGKLVTATTYYFQVVATNSTYGTAYGTVLSFTTPSAPAAVTSNATSLTGVAGVVGATLNGTVNANGANTTVVFCYSTSATLLNCATTDSAAVTTTTLQNDGSSNIGPMSFSQVLSGLALGTTYYFNIKATNVIGTRFGATLSFTTLNVPTVVSIEPTNLTSAAAVLLGTVQTNGSAVSAISFCWGRNADLSGCTTVSGTPGTLSASASGPQSVSASVSDPVTPPGLTGNYYFQVIATNAVGTSRGSIVLFDPGAAILGISDATSVSSTSATLNGTINAENNPVTSQFCYATSNVIDPSTGALLNCTSTSSAFSSAGSDITLHNVTLGVTGLSANTTYYVQYVANSTVSSLHIMVYSSVISFTTTGPPTATTQPAISVSSTGATIRGTTKAGGMTTNVSFCYGTASDLAGCTVVTASPATSTGTTATAANAVLTGLTPGTTYYYAIVAQNAYNTSTTITGSTLNFKTFAAPTVATSSSAISASGVTLNGTVNANGDPTTAILFCYAPNADLANCASSAIVNSIVTSPSSATGYTSASVSSLVTVASGLIPGTTYYFQIQAVNGTGTSYGSVLSFTVPLLSQTSPTTGSVVTTSESSYSAQLHTSSSNAVTYSENASANSSKILVSSSGVVTVVNTGIAAGVYTVTGTMVDTAGAAGVWSFTLTVTASTIVQATPLSAVTPANKSSLSLQLATTGSDGRGVTFSETSSSDSARVIVSSSGIVSVVAGGLSIGTYQVSGTMIDGSGDTGTWAFTLYVTNGTLVVAPTKGTTLASASAGYTAQFSAVGSNGGAVTYSVVSSGSIRVSSSGAISTSGALSVGTYSASGTATDSSGNTGSYSFTLYVRNGTLSITPTSGSTDAATSSSYTDQLIATGTDGGNVTFTEAVSANSGNVIVSSTGAITVIPTGLTVGAYSVGGTAYDVSGDASAWTYTLYITNGTLTQIAPLSASVPNTGSAAYTTQLNVSGSDGGAVTYSVVSTGGIRVSSSGVVTTSGALTAGTYSTSGTMTDVNGDAGTYSFTLTVTALATTPLTGTVAVASSSAFSQVLSTTGSANAITYAQDVSGQSSYLLFNASTHTITTTGALAVGSYVISGTTSDGHGNSGAWTFTLSVTASTLTTSSPSGSVTVPNSGAYSTTLTTTGNFGGSVSYVQTSGSSSLTISSGGTVTTTGVLSVGTYTAQATTSDPNGDTGSFTFTLTVSAGSLATSTTAATTTTLNSSGFTTSMLTTGNSGGAVSYVKASGSSSVSISTGGTVTTTGTLTPGDYVINVTTSDPNGNTGSFTFTLTVLGVVSYDANGGTVGTASATFASGASVTLPTPSYTGKSFNGWYNAATGGTRIGGAGFAYSPSASIQLFAQWTAITYTLTYDANGGSVSGGATATVNFTYGASVTFPTPAWPLHTFNGWYIAASSGSPLGLGGTLYSPAGTSTVYAQWTENGKLTTTTLSASIVDTSSASYTKQMTTTGTSTTITYTQTGGTPSLVISSSGLVTTSGVLAPGTYTAAATTAGTDASSGNFVFTLTVTGVVIYDPGSGALSGANWAAFNGGGSVTLPTPTYANHTFTGWFAASSGGSPLALGGASYSPAASTTLYAQWANIVYVVTYHPGNGAGNTTANFTTGGAALTLPTPTWSMHIFNGWYTASSGGSFVAQGGDTYQPPSAIDLYGQWSSVGSLTTTTSAASVTVAQSYPYAVNLITTGGTGVTTYVLTSGATYFDVSSSGVATTKATLHTGTYTFGGTTSDPSGAVGTFSFTLTVTSVNLVTTPSAITVTYSQWGTYQEVLHTTGGAGTYTYVQDTGGQDTQLNFNAATHTVTTNGPPSALTYTITGTVTDAYGDSGAWVYALTDPAGTLVTTSTSDTVTIANSHPYSSSLTTTGNYGNVTYSLNAPVTGISLSASGVVTTSTTLAPATYTISGTTIDQNADTGSFTFTLEVVAGSLITTPPTDTVLDASSLEYSHSLTSTGNVGTVSYTKTGGSSSLNVTSGGQVTTTGALSAGTYTVSGTTTDPAGNNGTFNFVLTVTASPPPPAPPAPTPPVTRVTTVKPGTPQNVVATQVSGIVTVSWTASGASAQYFTVSSVIDGNVCIVSGATACTLANPLTKGQKRSYAVVATNTAGDSDPGMSNEVSVPLDVAPTPTTTIPPVPPVVVPKITLTCFFAFNSSALSARAKADITAYAKQIIARHITSLTLAGYTDYIGGKAYNQKLSTARAKAVGVYLLQKLRSMSHVGVSVRMIGKGISRTSPERAQDRKVTVIS